ncbi:MAG TPA: TolC family protein [Planctomycetaceae bacterium]|nr:TolC family protein [Planctomycetaceae bacterium]
MSIRELLACCVIVSLSGCLYHARERTDGTVANLVSHPYDVMPAGALPPAAAPPAAAPAAESPVPAPQGTAPAPAASPSDGKAPASGAKSQSSAQLDVKTSKLLQASYEEDLAQELAQQQPKKFEPKIPPELPGSEAKAIVIPKEPEAKERAIDKIFPKLPPLAVEPVALQSPEGRAYSLSDLQFIAAGNSPELRQAASDVEAARGALIQARAYPNPNTGWQITPSNDGSVPSAQGPFIDQTIKTAGKLKLASASAEMDLQNAELALRRARSDLATRVRQAYYALLVAKETVRVNRALAKFTDEVYVLHTGLLQAGNAASYEPMALRAQAYSARLSYDQSIQNYLYAWKQVVTTIGQRQLPLTQVEGRIDAVIPYFDYDTVLNYVLKNHTDVLTARNGLDKAKYQLKLAQVTPIPDFDFNIALLKDYEVPPKALVPTATITFPLPIWDQNKGNIMSAEAALVRATEESHRVEMALTNALATNFNGYKTNLQALDYYRNHILPDQVRAYRGVLERRQLDPSAAFSDLFGAQQTLAGFVTTYLGVLSSLWTSAVSVADVLQSDDIFQLADPQAVPALPDLGVLLPFPCCHPSAPGEPLIHFETSSNAPRSLAAASTATPRQQMVAAVPKAAPVQPGTSAVGRVLVNGVQPGSVAKSTNPSPTAVGGVVNAAGNSATAGNSIVPASAQSVDKPFVPLTFDTHSAN